ncbi:MAG: hypothetical protein FJ044_00720 [Candidatus Cloacimonetes bacterium]|nr:hypothetical protein [Candidatus Cloacimonadota bacterium]
MQERLNSIQIENYRKMTGAQRLKILDDLYECSRTLVEASIKENLPDISEKELSKAVNRRMISLEKRLRP